jgi:hypothetical protein
MKLFEYKILLKKGKKNSFINFEIYKAKNDLIESVQKILIIDLSKV